MSKKHLGALGLAVLVAPGHSPFSAETAAPQYLFSPDLLVSTAEFPSQDAHLWRLERAGLIRKMAADRLVQKSYTPETVGLLLEAGRVDAALRVIREIVEHHRERIAPTFEVVAKTPHRISQDARTRGLSSVWRERIDEATKRVRKRPREEAARVARQLFFVDDRPPADGAKGPDRLRRFLQEYAGTEAASLAELDLPENSQPRSQRLEALDAFAQRFGTTVPGAKALLDVLAREPLDFAVLAARLGHASLRWKSGAEAEGESAVRAALHDWQMQQQQAGPRTALETEVADIRSVLFRPSSRTGRAAFYFVNPAIAVKLSDGGIHRVAIARPFSDRTNGLFFSAEESDLLERLATGFGGTPGPTFVHPGTQRPPRAVWDQFIARKETDRAAWEFRTYPVIREIDFLDAERTKAVVSTLDSALSGATIMVEKRGGRWIVGQNIVSWIS